MDPNELAHGRATPESRRRVVSRSPSSPAEYGRARDEIVAAIPDGPAVVVTHVTPIKLLLRLALDAPPSALFRLHLDTASVSIVDYFSDGVSSVRLVNDTGHLD